MDTKFQTSFIPKKPLLSDQNVIKRGSGGTSVFMFVAMIIFVASIAGVGFTFLWKQVLIKSQKSLVEELAKKEASFDVGLIERLKKANNKIDIGAQLLQRHAAVSEVFDIVSLLTIQGVRFTNFDFSASDAMNSQASGGDLKIVMKGIANNFSSVAFQSTVFGQSESFGNRKPLKNPVLSDLVLDPTGKVNFTFTAYVNMDDIKYEKTLNLDNNIVK